MGSGSCILRQVRGGSPDELISPQLLIHYYSRVINNMPDKSRDQNSKLPGAKIETNIYLNSPYMLCRHENIKY